MRRISPLYLLLAIFLLAGFAPLSAQATSSSLPAATPEKLPRWRGFNLLNKFQVTNQTPFEESDFRMIHAWGFNFVRLPMDYRCWIIQGDWRRINGDALNDVDQAIAWGKKYHIHVCLNFHRAPGYTVAKPPESSWLWGDAEAQRVCAMHWAYFARRYKGIPNEQLSFNLFNEPTDVSPKDYATVVAKMVAAIRAEDPNRLIICDGLAWAQTPVPELIPLNVAQSLHDYQPMELTHYQASWVDGSSTWPVPTWPIFKGVSGFLYGPWKKDLQAPLVLDGAFPAGTHLDLKVGTVSMKAHLVVRGDGQVVFEKTFVSGPEAKEGEKVVFRPEYNCYQNVFSQNESVTLPAAAKEIAITCEDGDWMTLDSLALTPVAGGLSYPLPLTKDWGEKQATVTFQPSVAGLPWSGGDGLVDRAWIHQHEIVPWQQLGGEGVGIMVGEWGCNNHTPYDVTLRWMSDTLAEFKAAGLGWALWNFKGSFGVVDSNRPGAVYQTVEGHKVDARMLELLQAN